MTPYDPDSDVGAAGDEEGGLVESGFDEGGVADAGTEDDADDEERPADWRLYTGERLESEKGTYRPQQMNVGRENEAGGGEWPDPDAEPQPPAPGAE
jgi:hypothetical protein